jgi:hypothetical protein
LAPSALVLAFAMLAATALVTPRAAGPLGLLAVVYGVVLAAAVVPTIGRGSAREIALVPAAIACMHAGYGAGLVVRGLRLALGRVEQVAERDAMAVSEPPAG